MSVVFERVRAAFLEGTADPYPEEMWRPIISAAQGCLIDTWKALS